MLLSPLLRYFLWTSLSFGMFLMVTACGSTKRVNPSSSKAISVLKEQVENSSNNQERLYKLMQGTFMRHVYNDQDSMILWRSNNGQDSVLTYIKAIGEPSKDGYLLIFASYLTKLPDEPYTCFLIKINQTSRDTLPTYIYNCPDYTLDDIVNDKVEEDFNLKEYTSEEGIPYYTFIKENNMKFSFTVPYSAYEYGGDDPNKQFSKSDGFVDISGQKTTWTFYTTEKEETHKRANYDIRRYSIDPKKVCELAKKQRK